VFFFLFLTNSCHCVCRLIINGDDDDDDDDDDNDSRRKSQWTAMDRRRLYGLMKCQVVIKLCRSA